MTSRTDELEESKSLVEHRHLFVLLNGKKSGDKHLRAAVKHLRLALHAAAQSHPSPKSAESQSHCRKEGHQVDVRVTWESTDAERYVEEALSLRTVNAIVAAGGDGTVNEVLCNW